VLHRIVSASHRKERLSFLLFAVALLVLSAPGAASAYSHLDTNLPPANTREVRGTITYLCSDCHVTWTDGDDEGTDAYAGAGPHGYYRSDTEKCRMCHIVHKAPANSIMLLPAATIQAACFTCHDATGAQGVYSGIVARGGSVTASHSIDTTTHVPGGSADLPTMLTCTSCHTVHRATTMAAFRTDRQLPTGGGAKYSNALLRDDVGGKPRGTFTTYSSDWCASCHDQRHSDSITVVNHPVESSTTVGAFNYGRVASVRAVNDQTTEIVGLGGSNFGYVMPYPRTDEQVGHDPICQQCHEDARSVGVPGAAVAFSSTTPTNPAYYSFPHQSTNGNFLIEEHDDLCTNCHPTAQLP
jgi:predicted CXXCH cytochrome family protein